MAYEPTVWKAGDVVTSAKLNKLENGVANAGLIVNTIIDEDGTRLDKTWQEIYDASVAFVLHEPSNSKTMVIAVYVDGDNYIVEASDSYYADSPDGYPFNGLE